MAHDPTTFDRHYEGKVLLDAVPTGVETKGSDFHFEGVAVIAAAATAGFQPVWATGQNTLLDGGAA